MQPTSTITILQEWKGAEIPIPLLQNKVDDHLFDILEQFEEKDDELSLLLHQMALKETDNRKFLNDLLVNPLDDKKSLVVDAMLDGDGWLWERGDLDDYLYIVQELGLECFSPYTNKPLKAESHPFATAISFWLRGEIKNTSEQCELAQYKGNSQEHLSLKLLVYQGKAKKAVYRKKFKMAQGSLLNSITKTNSNTIEMHQLISDVAKQARQSEQQRTELLEKQMAELTQAVDSTAEVIKSKLEDAEKALKTAVNEQDQLKQAITDLEEQRDLSMLEQERRNTENEAMIEQRVQVVEKIYLDNIAVNNAKISDVKQHVCRLEERSEIQLQQIARQEQRVKSYEIELGQVRAKANEQEQQINRLNRRVKNLQNWPF